MIVELLFIKTSLVLATAGLAGRSLRLTRASAASRSAMWSATFVVLLLLPLLEQALPVWRPLPQTDVTADPLRAMATAPDAAAAATTVISAGSHVNHAAAGPVQAASEAGPSRADQLLRVFAPWLMGIWIAGVMLALVRLFVSHYRVFRLARNAEPVDGALAALAADSGRRLGLTRHFRVALSPDLDVPVQSGVIVPVVLLPLEAVDWTPARQDAVLMHEIAHVARFDCLLRLVSELARAAYWPQPLIHWAVFRAGLALEQSADDAVLRAGTGGPDYAGHLAAIAATPAAHTPGAALAMARPSTLLPRVRAILDPRISRSTAGRRTLALTGLFAATIAVSVGAMRLAGESADAILARRARTALADTSAAVRRDAALTLGRLRDVEAQAALIAHLRDDDPQARSLSAWALGRLKQPGASAALSQAMHDADVVVRENAVIALGAIGDRSWTWALAAATRDTVWTVRAVTSHALGAMGGDAAADAAIDMLSRETDAHTRSMTVWAVRMANGSNSLAALVRMLDDPRPDVRGPAMGALRDLGDARAIPAIAGLLARDTSAMIRGRAAWILGSLKDPSAEPALIAALADPSWEVRVSVVGALGEVGGRAAMTALVPVLRDPVHQVRLTVVESLDRMSSR